MLEDLPGNSLVSTLVLKSIGWDGLVNTLASDISPEAERLPIELWREMPASRKMELLGGMYAAVKTLAREGLVQRFPAAAQAEINRRLADLMLGEELAEQVYGAPAYGARTSWTMNPWRWHCWSLNH